MNFKTVLLFCIQVEMDPDRAFKLLFLGLDSPDRDRRSIKQIFCLWHREFSSLRMTIISLEFLSDRCGWLRGCFKGSILWKLFGWNFRSRKFLVLVVKGVPGFSLKKIIFRLFISLTSVSGVPDLDYFSSLICEVFELLNIFWWPSFDLVRSLSRLLSLF